MSTWDAYVGDQEPTVLEASAADGIRLTTSRIDVLYRWAAFTRLVESHGVLVVFDVWKQVLIIPKRVFADEAQIEAFRQLVTEHLPPRSQGFPVVAGAGGGAEDRPAPPSAAAGDDGGP